LIVDGQEEGGIEGHVIPIKVRYVNRKRYNREFLRGHSGFIKSDPDHGIALEVGKGICFMTASLRIGWIIFRE
jgi:hypothetical protein